MSKRLRYLAPFAAATVLAACGSYAPGTIGAPAPTATPSMSMGTAATGMTADEMDAAMAARTKRFPEKTEGLGAQTMQPKIGADGSKEFDLTAAVTTWEVEAGKKVQAWTYNGTVPGPAIHVNIGDHVKIVLTNKLPESTVIHLHGLTVPNSMDGVPDITQPPVKPGQSFTYDFVAQGPAVGVYHSHHDAAKQVLNGLFGPIYVGQEPLPSGVQVSQQVPFILDDGGVIGLSINGKSFPATTPVVANLGDWVQVDYANMGLQIHPFHLHGLSQLVIAQDGYPVPQPYNLDTIMIAPGQTFTVLVHADQKGTWAWHCHILTHAESATGMFGMVTAMIVK